MRDMMSILLDSSGFRGYCVSPDVTRNTVLATSNLQHFFVMGYSLSNFAMEFVTGITYGLKYSHHHLIHSYVIIPIGIVTLFTILYGFNVLLSDVFKIEFPASVLGMLINLIFLCILDYFASLRDGAADSKRPWIIRVGVISSWILEKYLMLIQPCMNFSLKWINVFFIPSFVILPLSNHITFIECLKIAAVFLIGGVSLMLFDVYSICLLKKLLKALNLGHFDNEKISAANVSPPSATGVEGKSEEPKKQQRALFADTRSYISARIDITTIDVSSLRSTRTVPESKISSYDVSDNPFMNTIAEPDTPRKSSTIPQSISPDERTPSEITSQDQIDTPRKSPTTPQSISPDERTPSEITSQDQIDTPKESLSRDDTSENSLEHLTDLSKKVAILVSNYIDWFLFFVLFVVSLPLYYVRSLHIMMFYHLSITVLAYYLALLVPMKVPQLKKFAHPILISTAGILFVCFLGSLIYHKGRPKGFLDDLKYYKTGKTYLRLFNDRAMYNNGEIITDHYDSFTAVPLWPGCGDILSSLMDISIVSLSLPMFTYKRDFYRNFWILTPPILASMALTFFCYPLVCYHIGISSERSIGFIGRSVTLALGTPLISALGGSVSLMAVCTILSGILGVLIGDLFFSALGVPQDDYLTRGVTLGINCGAIATAHLLNVDPRAASMSSLSFSIFGTIMIILASVGAVRELIRSWVGL